MLLESDSFLTMKQEVDHVHFHVIPKPSEETGLVVGWPTKLMDKDELKQVFEEMKSKM